MNFVLFLSLIFMIEDAVYLCCVHLSKGTCTGVLVVEGA